MARLYLNIDDNVSEMLTKLAGGERRRGEYLTSLIRLVGEEPKLDLLAMRLVVRGLIQEMEEMRRRIDTIERHQSEQK